MNTVYIEVYFAKVSWIIILEGIYENITNFGNSINGGL